MRGARAAAAGLALAVMAGLPVMAQTDGFTTGADAQVVTPDMQAPVLTLDRARLFEGSQTGQAVLAQLEAESSDLLAENRRLEAALEAEERELTERRATMPIEDFRALAREFDGRVEELRVAQEAKGRALTRKREEEQQRFFETAVPVLAELMQDFGAVAIIERSAVIVSFDRIDITEQAIARLDAALGDGAASGTEGQDAAPGDPVQP